MGGQLQHSIKTKRSSRKSRPSDFAGTRNDTSADYSHGTCSVEYGKKGIKTDWGLFNKGIQERNQEYRKDLADVQRLQKEIKSREGGNYINKRRIQETKNQIEKDFNQIKEMDSCISELSMNLNGLSVFKLKKKRRSNKNYKI